MIYNFTILIGLVGTNRILLKKSCSLNRAVFQSCISQLYILGMIPSTRGGIRDLQKVQRCRPFSVRNGDKKTKARSKSLWDSVQLLSKFLVPTTFYFQSSVDK